jgi:hypothetical protein
MKLIGRVVSHMEAGEGRHVIRVNIQEGEIFFRELGLFVLPSECTDWPLGTPVTVTVEKTVEKGEADESQA